MRTLPETAAEQPGQPPLRGTYGELAPVYAANGYDAPIPLPYGQKKPPPTGFTGYGGQRPSAAQVQEWCEKRPHDGIAIVCPDGVVFFDTDNYAKGAHPAGTGAATLAAVVAAAGVELPPGPSVRNRDDGSEKRPFKVPDLKFKHSLGPCVDVITPTHRYVNVGINPVTGNAERWFDAGGNPMLKPPHPDTYPELPAELLPFVVRGADSREGRVRVAPEAQAREWLDNITGGVMSKALRRSVEKALDRLNDGGCRHDNMQEDTRWLVEKGAAGIPGVDTALGILRQQFVRAVKDDRDGGEAEAEAEFDDFLSWGARVCRPEMFNTLRMLDRNDGRIPMTRLGDGQAAETPASGGIFKVLTPSEWTQPVPPHEFIIRGALSVDTFGVNAGPKKSLKTHDNQALFFAVGTGQNLYGSQHFPVDRPRRVLYIVGEGGELPVRRTLQRMGRAYGVDMAELARDPSAPLVVAFGAAPINSDPFRDELKSMLDTHQPDVVLIESFYNFHPGDVQSGDLYQRGQIIDDYHKFVRGECEGATSLLTDHYRSTATKSHDLDNISMAGQAENADSWITRFHRKEPNVPKGEFYLHTAFGSRQWGGTEWHVDWNLGQFDHDLGHHVGEISWVVRSAHDSPEGGKLDRTGESIVQIVRDNDFELTETQVVDKLGGNKVKAREAVKRLVSGGRLTVESRERIEGGRARKRDLVGLVAPARRVSLVPGAGTDQETGSR